VPSVCSGLGKASLIVCVSQAPYLFDETINVLKFASIANRVTVEQFKEPAPVAASRNTASRFSSMLAGGGKGSSLLLSSVLSGHSTIAWEEPRSRSTMIPDMARTADGRRSKMVPTGRPVPTNFGARFLSLAGVEEEEANESNTEQDTTVVEPEQVRAWKTLLIVFIRKRRAITVSRGLFFGLITESLLNYIPPPPS
jgi:hypothetical protein